MYCVVSLRHCVYVMTVQLGVCNMAWYMSCYVGCLVHGLSLGMEAVQLVMMQCLLEWLQHPHF